MKRLWIVMVVLVGLRFGPFLWGKTLYFGDNFSLMVPGKMFTANWLKQGILPLWNPTIFAGIPWISEINQSVLYPTTVLFMVLPAYWALNMSLIIHLAFTFTGMYMTARWLKLSRLQSVTAGVVWAYSTQITGSINNLSTIQSLSWFPWLVYWGMQLQTHKWAFFWFPLSVTLMFLGGYPQHVVLAIMTALLFSAYLRLPKQGLRRWLGMWIVAGMITGLVSAPAWLPFAKDLLNSTRVVQSLEQAQTGSLIPTMMMKAVLPYAFDLPLVGMKWGPAWSGQPNMFMYVGWFGLVLILLSLVKVNRKRWHCFLAGIVGGSIVFSLGSNLPGYELVQQILPIFRWGRYPSMLMIVATFTIALWLGSSMFTVGIPKRLGWWIKRLLAVVALGGIGVFLVTYVPGWWESLDDLLRGRLTASPFHTFARDEVIARVVGLDIVAVAFFSLLAIHFYLKKLYVVVLMLLVVDLFIHTQGNLFFIDSAIYEPPDNWLREEIGNDLSYYRLLARNGNKPYTDYGMYWEAMVVRSPFSDSFIDKKELTRGSVLNRLKNGLTPDWNMPAGVPVVNGYTALLPQDFVSYWGEDDETRINFLPEIDPDSSLANRWSVGYYLVDTGFALYDEVFSDALVAEQGPLKLYRMEDALPRFRAETVDGMDVTVLMENPNRVYFEVETDLGGSLIMADRYDPDWKAWVNDVEIKIQEMEGMRRISVPAGRSTVRMQYVPRIFYIALGLSGAGLLTAYLFWKKFPSSDKALELQY